jgi:hypothetical protein
VKSPSTRTTRLVDIEAQASYFVPLLQNRPKVDGTLILDNSFKTVLK